MKKLVLLAVLALVLGAAAVPASAAWKIDITNDADGALFLINLKKKTDTDIQVYNNANVSLTETVVNTTGTNSIAGGDSKANFSEGGDIDSVSTDLTSVNDIFVAVNDCPCEEGDPSSDVVEIVNGEEGNDAIFDINAKVKEETDFQTANNLEYSENLTEVNTSGTNRISGDDMKENVDKGGKIDRTTNRTRNLGTVTFLKNIPIVFFP